MKLHQVLGVARSRLKYRDISCLSINCNDHPCSNFVFPGGNIDMTEDNDTEKQKVEDTPDVVEDTAKILTPEKKDNYKNKTNKDIDHMPRSCRTFEDIQKSFAGSGT